MMAPLISHNKPWITDGDRAAVARVLDTGWIAQGPGVEALEQRFTEDYGGGGACSVSSGTAALFLALKALGIGKGSAIAVPSYACSALLNAVYMAGAEPVVLDCGIRDFTLDADQLHDVRDRVDAVIAVHTYGARADLSALARAGVPVIEDCCQSLGGTWSGRPIGGEGICAIFSFYATKIITGGQGGLIWDPSGALAGAARDYREFDCRQDYAPRFNFQMTDMQAALAGSQYDRLEKIAERRRAIARRYDEALPQRLERVTLTGDKGAMPYRYVVRASGADTIAALKKHMLAAGITCIVPLERYELLHRYLGLEAERYPNAERAVETTLSLPLYPALTDAQIDTVALELARFSA